MEQIKEISGTDLSLIERNSDSTLTLVASTLPDLARESMDKRGMTALVFIDLNGRKKINDDLGHEMDDLVLRKIAQRLLRFMRPSDTVARLGGDEFVLVLEGIGAAGDVRKHKAALR